MIGFIAFLFAISAALAVFAFGRRGVVVVPDIEDIYDNYDNSAFGRYIRPVVRSFVPQRQIDVNNPNRQSSGAVESLLIRSGNPWKLRPDEFTAVRMIAMVIAGLIGFLVTLSLPFPLNILIMLVLLFVGYMQPRNMLANKAKKRMRSVIRDLPECIDLIRICMEAGRELPAALAETTKNLPDGVMKTELGRASSELDAGMTTTMALNNLAARLPTMELQTFCASIIQAERLGADITGTLADQARQARTAANAAADVRIRRLESTLIIPIGIFMLPSVLGLIIIPAGFQILQAFSGHGGG